jgi:hypothetical protein
MEDSVIDEEEDEDYIASVIRAVHDDPKSLSDDEDLFKDWIKGSRDPYIVGDIVPHESLEIDSWKPSGRRGLATFLGRGSSTDMMCSKLMPTTPKSNREAFTSSASVAMVEYMWITTDHFAPKPKPLNGSIRGGRWGRYVPCRQVLQVVAREIPV